MVAANGVAVSLHAPDAVVVVIATTLFAAVFLATGVKVAAVVSVNVNGFRSSWLFLQLSMALLLLLLLKLSLFLMLLPLLKRLLLSSYQIHLQAKFLNFKNECRCLVAQCD